MANATQFSFVVVIVVVVITSNPPLTLCSDCDTPKEHNVFTKITASAHFNAMLDVNSVHILRAFSHTTIVYYLSSSECAVQEPRCLMPFHCALI